MLDDLRSAMRLFSRAPAFSAAAVLSLGVAIALNVAILGLIGEMLLGSRAIGNPDELVLVRSYPRDQPGDLRELSVPALDDLREVGADTLSVAGFMRRPAHVSSSLGAEQRIVHLVTPGYFDVLAVRLAWGRWLGADDQPAAVLTHSLARRLFGSSEPPEGYTLRINRVEVPVVGVAERGFKGMNVLMDSDALFLPLTAGARIIDDGTTGVLDRREARILTVIGRLRSGTGFDAAQAQLAVIGDRLSSDHAADRERGLTVTPFAESYGGRRLLRSFPVLPWLAAIAGVVALIAATNVSGLLLARGIRRQRELAVRTSIGASRWRLARLLLVESFLLAVVGSAVGLLLGVPGRELLWRVRPVLIADGVLDRPLDGTVLIPTLVLCLLTTLGAGLLPAMRLAKQADGAGFTSMVQEGGRGHSRSRRALLVLQIALSTVVTGAAALSVRSVANLLAVDPGFEAEGVTIFSFTLLDPKYDANAGLALQRTATERIVSLPGVESVSTATVFYGASLVAEARDAAAASDDAVQVTVALNSVTPDYFDTARIRLLAGRAFDSGDREGAPPVAIVSASIAKRLWPDENPIGKRVLATETASEVVGVVADNRGRTIAGEDYPWVYRPLDQEYGPTLSIHVRSQGGSVTRLVVGILADLDPDLPVWPVSLSRLVADSLWAQRTAATLLSLFGSLALALCGVGLFAMVAFNASQRTRELAIRSALGASRRALAATVGREAAFLVGAGIAIGTAGLIAAGRFAKSFLHELSVTDPASLAGTALLLAMVSAAACLAPLRRAAKVDPAAALRSE